LRRSHDAIPHCKPTCLTDAWSLGYPTSETILPGFAAKGLESAQGDVLIFRVKRPCASVFDQHYRTGTGDHDLSERIAPCRRASLWELPMKTLCSGYLVGQPAGGHSWQYLLGFIALGMRLCSFELA
jgi:hypothetical protein